LAVFGVGGLGHLAVQIGRGLGAIVTAIDVTDEKLARAKELGASVTLNSAASNVVKEIRRAGGVHAALVASAAKAAYDTAFRCVRPTGSLLVVGLPSEPICFPAIQMAGLEVHIQASSVGTRDDIRELLTMAAAGKIHSQITTRPLADANEVLAELREGRVSGRIVLTPR
jgi:propanol-preferring alcohol dehydrogenase